MVTIMNSVIHPVLHISCFHVSKMIFRFYFTLAGFMNKNFKSVIVNMTLTLLMYLVSLQDYMEVRVGIEFGVCFLVLRKTLGGGVAIVSLSPMDNIRSNLITLNSSIYRLRKSLTFITLLSCSLDFNCNNYFNVTVLYIIGLFIRMYILNNLAICITDKHVCIYFLFISSEYTILCLIFFQIFF
jgi:hypothetical protein